MYVTGWVPTIDRRALISSSKSTRKLPDDPLSVRALDVGRDGAFGGGDFFPRMAGDGAASSAAKDVPVRVTAVAAMRMRASIKRAMTRLARQNIMPVKTLALPR